MLKGQWYWFLGSAALLGVGAMAAAPKKLVAPAPKPAPTVVPQPKARYAMDIGTTTGLAGMAGGGA